MWTSSLEAPSAVSISEVKEMLALFGGEADSTVQTELEAAALQCLISINFRHFLLPQNNLNCISTVASGPRSDGV